MTALKRPFLRIETKSGTSFGGNQSWFPYKFLQKSGCGIISGTNVLLYLEGRREMSQAEYMDFAKRLWKRYLPVLPGVGMNGLTLAMGLNRYFIRQKLPYRACWKISGKKLLSRIDLMLSEDIPVILAVGPDFPKFWKRETLKLYAKTKDGNYAAVTKTRAHFVTVTGREDLWLRISSWGKEYYMNIPEYREYVAKHSSFLVSNIICIYHCN